MIVDLNVVRETLTVQRIGTDQLLPGAIQRLLRQGGVSFKTLDASGTWLVPANQVIALADSLTLQAVAWTSRAVTRLEAARELALERRGDSPTTEYLAQHTLTTKNSLKRRPFIEQEEAATCMSAPGIRSFGLFWKPGTGKTGAIILGANELLARGTISGVLVVAERPQAVLDPWRRELRAWLPDQSGPEVAAFVNGDTRTRAKAYLDDPRWLVIHYGLLRIDAASLIAWAHRHSGIEPPVIIFDESDLIKNPEALRSKAALEVRRSCGRCWIASGMPAPQSPVDYQHQLTVLYGFPVDIGLSGSEKDDAEVVVHELDKGLHYLQRDNPRRMPEQLTIVRLPLTLNQREIYERLADDLANDVESMTDEFYSRHLTEIAARRQDLLRVCSDASDERLGEFDFSDGAKVQHIDQLLRQLLAAKDEKVVIWTRFRNTALKLWERYDRQYGAVLLIGGSDGSSGDLSRPDKRVLVATLQKGASSIDLTAARNAVYESLDDVARNFFQSKARINRTGQARECRYWVLVAENTVEEDVIERITQKTMRASDVLSQIGMPHRGGLVRRLRSTILSLKPSDRASGAI